MCPLLVSVGNSTTAWTLAVRLKHRRVAVQEFFGDFVALDGHHFSVPVSRPACLLQPFNWDVASCSEAVDRMTEGLAAVALSLRRRFTIRFAGADRGAPKEGL